MYFLCRQLKNALCTRILIDKGYKIPVASGLSTQLNNKRIRFETVQQILDYLGYEIVIREKK